MATPHQDVPVQLGGLGETTISDQQRSIHVLTEVASVLMVPAVFSAARAAKGKHKRFLTFLGWAMLIVDGALLLRWANTP